MFNSKNLVKLIFLLFILLLIIAFLDKNTKKSISLKDVELDNKIVFVYDYQNHQGLAYSLDDLSESDNYILGKAYNLYNDIQLFENCDGQLKSVETLSSSNDLNLFLTKEDIDYSIFTFKSGNTDQACRLGVILSHQDQSKSYRYLSGVE